MFQFIGYNFFSDGDCLNNAPANVNNITTVELRNAIWDHFNVTRNTDTPVSQDIPTQWDYDTIMNADFNGDLDAGNIDWIINEITAIEIKRRIAGGYEWVTLARIPINSVEDLTFVFNDNLNAYGTQYEYAFVPILEDVEGEYIINTIYSKFNGVFVADADTIYKFLYGVEYSNNTRNQQIGTFEVLGKKYPVIVANGNLAYETGSVTGIVLNDNFEDGNVIDRVATTKKLNEMKDFLTNKRAKVLKDYNGNIWLVVVTDNLTVTYDNSFGQGVPSLTFNWTQIGDANNQQDLYNSGLVKEV